MSVEIKMRTKRNIQYFSCIAIFILLQVGITLLNRNGMEMFNGICSAFQYASCLVLVKTNGKRGIITSFVLLGITMILIVGKIAVFGPTNALSGLFNLIFYIVTIAWLGDIFAKQEKKAVTDVLTGLLNRRGLHEAIREAIEDEKPFYLLDLEIGNFKLINDSYGHIYGDILLKKITERITSYIGDRGIVTRNGGAEFVIILKETENAEDDANNLLNTIRERIFLSQGGDYMDCFVTAFAGLVSFPQDTDRFEDLIKYADMAMVEALSHNDVSVRLFKHEMAQRLTRHMELEYLIKEGIEHDYFYLVYQPQYVLCGKELHGFETLIRMKLPDGTIVSPCEFIPVAEMTEQIILIDYYVLRRAMNEYKNIVNENQDIIVSVNVSAKNIGSKSFAQKVTELINETGFPAKNLEIEITEYCMVSSVNTTIDNIDALRKIGVRFALDDFGTGYTSLSYLSKLPVNLLKIDKSLIDNIETDKKKCEFVNTIVSMGHLMGCEVIAEGVENERQLEKLDENKCDLIQGYVWGKPLDYETAKNLALK